MTSGQPGTESLLEAVERAIAQNDPVRLRSLLKRGELDINEPLDSGGYRLLTYALETETDVIDSRLESDPGYVPDCACIRVLLEFGADPALGSLGGTPRSFIMDSPSLHRLHGLMSEQRACYNQFVRSESRRVCTVTVMTSPRFWHASDGDTDYDLMLQPWSVQFSSGGRSQYSGGSSSCSHRQFREGHFHDDIERHFGPEVLREVLSLLVDVSDDPYFGAQGRLRDELIAWSDIVVDETLDTIAERADDTGGPRFHEADAAHATTDGYTMSMDRYTATITGPDGTSVTIDEQLSLTALLAHDGRFYLAAHGHAYVFDTSGAAIASTEHLAGSYGLSNALRVSDVIRAGDDIAFTFDTFGGELDPQIRLVGKHGAFRLSDGGTITARSNFWV